MPNIDRQPDELERAAHVLRVLHESSAAECKRRGNRQMAGLHGEAVQFIDYAVQLHQNYNYPTPEVVTDGHWARAWRNRYIGERVDHHRAAGLGYEEARAQAEDDANTFEDTFKAEMEARAHGGRKQ